MNGPRCEHDPNKQTRHTKQLSGAHAFALQNQNGPSPPIDDRTFHFR